MGAKFDMDLGGFRTPQDERAGSLGPREPVVGFEATAAVTARAQTSVALRKDRKFLEKAAQEHRFKVRVDAGVFVRACMVCSECAC